MKRLIFTMFLLLAFSSCNRENVEANFSVTILDSEVYFLNSSIDANDYEWNFGDGKTSFERNPKHKYSRGGSYTVTLTAKGKKKSSTFQKTINAPYEKAYIKKVTVTAFPLVDGSGSSWDIASNPDIYLRILSPNPNNNTLLQSPVLNNATAPFFWTPPQRYLIPTNNEFYFLNLYDYDTPGVDPDDDMGAVSFRITDFPSYPAQITRTQNNITVIFDMEWE